MIAERFRGLDDIVNMSYAFIQSIPLKDEAKRVQRPVKVWEVATAYALLQLRESPALDDISNLADYPFPTLENDDLHQFLIDLEDGIYNQSGPLADFAKVRVSSSCLNASDESSFAQVLICMREYFAGNVPVDSSFCLGGAKGVTGKDRQSGSVFTYVGGADQGPKPKAKKSDE
jgi:hypothetical protein